MVGGTPREWSSSFVMPIYKKGERNDLANYRPIRLLDVIGKHYTKHLLLKLEEWVIEYNLLAPEQISFREGHSTLDHIFVLNHLNNKYAIASSGQLYVAFIDLKAAFYSIPRGRLWEKHKS